VEQGANGGARVTAEAGREEVVIRMPNLFGWFERAMPPEFVAHMRAARREQLLALRCLIDAAIERTERSEQEGRRRRRVEIEVD
jgi:hypothetical protein